MLPPDATKLPKPFSGESNSSKNEESKINSVTSIWAHLIKFIDFSSCFSYTKFHEIISFKIIELAASLNSKGNEFWKKNLTLSLKTWQINFLLNNLRGYNNFKCPQKQSLKHQRISQRLHKKNHSEPKIMSLWPSQFNK